MKSASATQQFVIDRISYIYDRPLMYGDRPESVDLLLYYYHELIAYIDSSDALLHEAVKLLRNAHEVIQKEIDCPIAMCFGAYCRQRYADESDDRLATRIVELWKRVDRELTEPTKLGD